MIPPRPKTWLRWWLVAYALLAAAFIGGMFHVRQSVFATYSSPESIADWRQWKSDVERGQTNPGPVQRRVPKSDEPPALVLMRDYFAVSLTAAVFFTSLLYWVMAWLITGAVTNHSTSPNNTPSPSGRGPV
jgi:hypothetical protein